ncbi:peptidase S8/S53 domain-containing protein [Neurospora tetraspora]|uniref:tripeptidyl-peptidase II n=1 Tax=Neurospora tetraspora TaxID=94610 RepID=A0AAE0J9N0_9PEZI|nr:peptidase S8/S53 domain-containing protein [Neurospora tetraspora]
MFQFHIWALLGLFALLSSFATALTIVLEDAGHLPAGWKLDHHATDSDQIQLSIALKEAGIEELKRRLLQQSTSDNDPNSRHLTKEEVDKHRQPDRKSVTEVGRWLQSHGIKSYKAENSWITFDATAATVKALFEADLTYYSYNGDPSTRILRARSYTIPKWLNDDIDFVHPLTHFTPPRNRNDSTLRLGRRQPTQPELSAREGFFAPPCWTGTFPGCIRKLYNLTYTHPPRSRSPSPVRFGIAGFLEQYITHRDVTSFLTTYAPELLPPTPTPSRGGSGGSLTRPPVTNTTTEPPYNITITLLNNATPWDPHPTDPALSSLEANLDVQYALSLGHPTQVIYYATGGRGTKLDSAGRPLPANDPRANNEPFLEFLQALLALPDTQIPHVLSISYADDEQSVPRKYAHRVCDLFVALAARGTTVLVATGDGGAAGIGFSAGGGDSCIKNDGSGRRAFVPTFPASCPWVTSVGATDNTALNLTGAEFSSGGFSEYFDRPLWQRAAVDPYVSSLLRSQSSKPGQPSQPRDQKGVYFSHNGRGTPDIAAIGSGFQIMHRGEIVEVRGTSASTPVVAAMVALVNDQRLRQGKRSLGWLNGYLYLDQRVRGVLRDVEEGRSEGCVFPGDVMEEGKDKGKGKAKGEGRRHYGMEKRQGNSTEEGGGDGNQGEGDEDGEEWEWEGEAGVGEGEGIGEGDRSGNVIVGGWEAKGGWDPVTGLGVPGDFQDMLRVLGGG